MIGGLIGRKLGMTQIFDDAGRYVPVTVIEVGPCFVTQLRTAERDGYSAVQIGFGAMKKNRVTKPKAGHLEKAGLKDKPVRKLAEFPTLGAELELGQQIRAEDVFQPGDVIKVTGTSKGKGFAGVVKRYHHHGGPMTHGSMTHRRPLSSGATGPQRVMKNHNMPGRMGAETTTQPSVTVVRVDAERNLILIKGAAPGGNNGIVYLWKARRD